MSRTIQPQQDGIRQHNDASPGGYWIDSLPLVIAFVATFTRVWLAVVRGELAETGPCLALVACLFTGGLLIGDIRAWLRRRSARRTPPSSGALL